MDIAGLTRKTGRTWVVTYVPLYGIEMMNKKNADNQDEKDQNGNPILIPIIPPTTAGWRAAWNGLPNDRGPKATMRQNVQALISADRHHFQTAKREGVPVQISSGGGGVSLDPVPHVATKDCKSLTHATLDPQNPDDLNPVQVQRSDAEPGGVWSTGWRVCTNDSWGFVTANLQLADSHVFKFVPVAPDASGK
ncbi:MAG: hypothetical protein VW268_00980 [Rhodospirillaceae bacterium]